MAARHAAHELGLLPPRDTQRPLQGVFAFLEPVETEQRDTFVRRQSSRSETCSPVALASSNFSSAVVSAAVPFRVGQESKTDSEQKVAPFRRHFAKTCRMRTVASSAAPGATSEERSAR
jgi:hypothetical protein